VNKSSKAGLIGAGLGVLTFAPAAGAHHSEPYCYWGQGVLPKGDVLKVTIERDHFMQSECDGTTVRVRLVDGRELVVVSRSDEERRAAEQRDARASESQATKAKPKKAKRRKGRKRGR